MPAGDPGCSSEELDELLDRGMGPSRWRVVGYLRVNDDEHEHLISAHRWWIVAAIKRWWVDVGIGFHRIAVERRPKR